MNQDCCENLFSVVRSLGSGPHPNPLEFATRMRVIKVKGNISALVPDGANVKLANDDNIDDPCLESDLGIILKYSIAFGFCTHVHHCSRDERGLRDTPG